MNISARQFLFALASLILAACAPASSFAVANPASTRAAEGSNTVPSTPISSFSSLSLRDYGPAPELTNTVWRNTPDNAPLRLADLRGKVVAIDFWTFG